MAEVLAFAPGGYRYIQAIFQHSGGVAAEAGFEIERARFARPPPVAEGFAAVEAHLKSIGRPTTAFAACELRSPAAFTEQEFLVFNRRYVQTLERWGLVRNERNPVARSNVCPQYGKPAEPSLYAFSYTVPARKERRSFVISGGVEAPDGRDVYRKIVRLGETSIDAMRDKMHYVLAKMEQRLHALGFGWQDVLATQVYTVQDIGALASEMAKKGITREGLCWHFSRPPVANLEFEMDLRSTARDVVL
jgi:hypothetical protein